MREAALSDIQVSAELVASYRQDSRPLLHACAHVIQNVPKYIYLHLFASTRPQHRRRLLLRPPIRPSNHPYHRLHQAIYESQAMTHGSITLLGLLGALFLAPISVRADAANPAPGIETWCNYTETSYVPQSLTRITVAKRGSWACVGPYGNYPISASLDYTGCPVSCPVC